MSAARYRKILVGLHDLLRAMGLSARAIAAFLWVWLHPATTGTGLARLTAASYAAEENIGPRIAAGVWRELAAKGAFIVEPPLVELALFVLPLNVATSPNAARSHAAQIAAMPPYDLRDAHARRVRDALAISGKLGLLAIFDDALREALGPDVDAILAEPKRDTKPLGKHEGEPLGKDDDAPLARPHVARACPGRQGDGETETPRTSSSQDDDVARRLRDALPRLDGDSRSRAESLVRTHAQRGWRGGEAGFAATLLSRAANVARRGAGLAEDQAVRKTAKEISDATGF